MEGERIVDKIRNWLMDFMRGRYGVDALGQAMSIAVIVLVVFSIVVNILAMIVHGLLHLTVFGNILGLISTVVNWVAFVLLALSLFRMFSKNHEKRRSENERYLGRKAKRQNKQQLAKDKKNYDYLTCQFCGQKMRVPKGKGKIAVKCPACGEKTITNS